MFAYALILAVTYLVDSHDNVARKVTETAQLNEELSKAQLAALLRQPHRPDTTLAEEVEYLQRYVDIQKVRFGERLEYSLEIPAALIDKQVPSFLLQPLVENAIKHGLAERVAGGEIRVAAERKGIALCLSVYNDGPDFAAEWESKSAGVGLANLRARLHIMHGDAADLIVRSVAGHGVEVVVTLPVAD